MFIIFKGWMLLIFSATWLLSCGAVSSLSEDSSSSKHLIYVVSNGWHSAIVVSAQDLRATQALPEAADFPAAEFLELGWGDRIYYPAKDKTFGMTLKAGLVPTPAVMHIAQRQTQPTDQGPKNEVIPLWLTEAGFQNLIRAFAADFERPSGKDRALSISRGLYSDSFFYNAHGEFHLFNTCNTWTARKLRAGGVDISPSGIVTADGLMDNLRSELRK